MVTIGVTGHQALAEVEKLESGLDEVAHQLEVAFPEEWTVMSALAEGADRLVAKRLMTREGTRLLAVLPMSRQEYEADFESAASKKEFGELLDDADEVMEIPPQPHRDDAYEAGGKTVLEESDVLVAVWDGQAAQGIGGTGGIVAEARRRKMPIAWIHAGNRKPGTREPTNLGADQGIVTVEYFPRPCGKS